MALEARNGPMRARMEGIQMFGKQPLLTQPSAIS